MLHIKDNGELHLTRGDTAYIQVPIDVVQSDGAVTPYVFDTEDMLTLTVKNTVKDTHICFQKFVKGGNLIHIEPKDTRNCDFGKYTYDVQLTTANGDIFTVIEPACFRILPEVTC